MKRLNEEEYINNAKPPLLKLFGTEIPDPFGDPFSPEIEQKLIIAGGVPKNDFLHAIKNAALEQGDQGFFLCNRPWRTRRLTYSYNWYIHFDEIDNFKDETLVDHFQYTYYSPQGLWGLVTSDVHGILGGSAKFCKAVYKMMPEIAEDVIDFVSYWQRVKSENPERITLAWLQPMLISIYGEKKANALLLQG